MAILLLGRWDHGGNLLVEDSQEFEDNDDEGMNAAATEDDKGGMAWAASFLVDNHSRAVQCAYEEYVRDEDGDLIDEVEGFQPTTD
ncbi:hypothetical protein ABTY59_32030 [Streptomyces sp. NPDC096079]|uniref:hypothetical protein n=1 Tax=Streptomyces sp. NPDC096079 TaxID=3155820 RepID=UPI003322E301